MPFVSYSGDVEVSERGTPEHSAVQNGSGSDRIGLEVTALGGRGGSGSHIQGIQHQVSEGGNHLQGDTIGAEFPGCETDAEHCC